MASVKKTLTEFFDVLRDLSRVYRWKETWTVISVTLFIVGFWLLFALAISLPNPWRSIIMWGVILGLAILAPER